MMKKLVMKILLGICVIFIIIFSLFPIYWIFVSSISTRIELYSVPPHWIPYNPTLDNYIILLFGAKEVLAKIPFAERYKVSFSYAAESFLPGLRNSIILAISVAFISIIVSTISGYVFARYNIRGKNALFFIVIILIPLPIWVSLVQLYSLMKDLKLLDTLVGLCLLHLVYRVPFDSWLMRTFFEALPKEIEEASFIDGCSRLSSLRKVLLPIIAPALSSVLIISFLSTWSSFLIPLIFSSSLNSQPLTVILAGFFRFEEPLYEMMSAAAIIGLIPSLIFIIFFQRYIVSGLLTMVAYKG